MQDIQTDLEELYLEYKAAYYKGEPLVSDDEFDAIEEKLKELGSSVVEIVGFEDKNTHKEYHPSSMLSLGKSQVRESTKDVKDAIDGLIKKSLSTQSSFRHVLESTPKLDGNAVNVIYKDHVLHLGITRGNKLRGTNVTEQIRNMVPARIDIPGLVEIRGEVIMPKDIYEAKYAHLYKNSRNFIAGVIGTKADDKGNLHPVIMNKEADFVPFEVRQHKTTLGGYWNYLDNTMTFLKKSGFTVVEPNYFQSFEEFDLLYDNYLAQRPSYKYQLDGLVLKCVEDSRHVLGDDGKAPKWALAIKFPPKDVITPINDHGWRTGTTGEVFPVGLLEPVDLDGSTVKRVSMYNYGWVLKNKCFIGAKVLLVKSGDIIPQIVKVVVPSTQDFVAPTQCPSCKHKLTIEGDHLMCYNKDCEAQLISKFARWIGALDIDSLGGATVKLLFDAGIKTPELFIKNFNKEFLIASGLFKEGRSLEKLISGWNNVKEIEGLRIVYAFGINNAGMTISKQIAYFYNDMKYDFKGLEKKIIDTLTNDPYYKERYFSIQSMLESIGKQVVIRSSGESTTGKIKIELTGKPLQFNNIKTKSDLINLMNNFNYIHTELKDAEILITDDLSSNSSKMKFAKTKNIKIITYSDFYELLNLKINPL